MSWSAFSTIPRRETLLAMTMRFAFLFVLVCAGCAQHNVLPQIDAGRPDDAGFDADGASDAEIDAEIDAASDAIVDAGECVPASTDCVGRVPRVCTEEGRWTPGRVCSRACDEGVCVRCTPGDFLPETWGPNGALTVLRCTDAYEWVIEPCASGQCGYWPERPADCGHFETPECGLTGDGFGGFTDCDLMLGGCPSGFSCGTDTNANTCVATSPSAMEECTPGTDDCAGPVARRCNRAGKWLPLIAGERCGTPAICVENGFDCGTTNDELIGMVACGTCPDGYVCGRFAPNHCAPEALSAP